mmetsp:Transcript_18461/g.42126  ORF Transcript_18461/g.42126 Transcript_18461/m.42126 type:complete len:137 (+) Transcript_18461:116-526(+)
MPDDVRQAKRIKYKIGKKAELSDVTEEFHLEHRFKSSNEEDITDDQRRLSTPTTQPTVQSTIPSTTSTTTTSTTKETPPPPPSTDHGSTITPIKRSYTSRVQTQQQSPFAGGDLLLHTYQMSLQHDKLYQEREARP